MLWFSLIGLSAAAELIGIDKVTDSDGVVAITFAVPNHLPRGFLRSRTTTRPSHAAHFNYKDVTRDIELSCQRGLDCNCQILVKGKVASPVEKDQVMHCTPSTQNMRIEPMGHCHVRVNVKALVEMQPNACYPLKGSARANSQLSFFPITNTKSIDLTEEGLPGVLTSFDGRVEKGLTSFAFDVPNHPERGAIASKFYKRPSHPAHLMAGAYSQDLSISCHRDNYCECSIVLPNVEGGHTKFHCEKSPTELRLKEKDPCRVRVILEDVTAFTTSGEKSKESMCYPVHLAEGSFPNRESSISSEFSPRVSLASFVDDSMHNPYSSRRSRLSAEVKNTPVSPMSGMFTRRRSSIETSSVESP